MKTLAVLILSLPDIIKLINKMVDQAEKSGREKDILKHTKYALTEMSVAFEENDGEKIRNLFNTYS